MVARVLGTFTWGPHYITLEEANFGFIEQAAKRGFDEVERHSIEGVLNDYQLMQSHFWSQPRPREVNDKLQLVVKHIDFCLSDLAALGRSTESMVGGAIRSLIEDQWDELAKEKSLLAENADFPEWLDGLRERLNALRQLLLGTAPLPPDGGGRSDAKDQFPNFVAALADIWESTGARATVSPELEMPFESFVDAVQSFLPEKFQYAGRTTLTKIIANALSTDRATRTKREPD